MCQFMDISKTDEILADFLIQYKIDDQDPKPGTFRAHWFSIKRQFSQRGLKMEKHNFPKTMTSLEERGKVSHMGWKNGRKVWKTFQPSNWL